MNIIERGRAFLQSLRELAGRYAVTAEGESLAGSAEQAVLMDVSVAIMPALAISGTPSQE